MKSFILFIILVLGFSLKAQEVKFDKKQIKLGKKILQVEIAESFEQLKTGLMERLDLKEDHGMLFIYAQEQTLSFWMKNTYIPLSIGFFDENKKLFDIQKMEPVKSVMDQDVKHYRSRGRAKYALEVNQGWFARNGIKKGMTFQFLKMPKAKPQKKKK